MRNIEIKASTQHPAKIKKILQGLGADFKGIDHQIDTYFKVPEGRLKLREGNIENSLIFYQRPNQPGPKASDFLLHHPDEEGKKTLKALLTKALGQRIVVDKQRAIYFIDNVKFHVDEVKRLGSFVEIEVMDIKEENDQSALLKQCEYYMDKFGIKTSDLLEGSYSDMVKN